MTLILILGCLHGLIYVFLAPPGAHYDEPGHMDYAWLAANQPGWPEVNDFNQYMRREQLALLIRTDFFRDAPAPNLVNTTPPLWSGIPQVVDPPLYHFLVSLPLRLLRGTDLAMQYTAGRLVSFLFYILSIWLAGRIASEVTPPGNPLRWMVPFALAALPAFADLMTALNNDSAAVALFSLWILAAVRLVRRGINLPDLALLVITAGLCVLTKKSVWLALPLSGLALLLALVRGRHIRWLALLFPALLAGLLVIFHFEDAGTWLRGSDQPNPNRVDSSLVPGTHGAIQLDIGSGSIWPAVYQLIDLQTLDQLRGQTVTVGGWIWADRVENVQMPGLAIVDPDYQLHSILTPVTVGTEPRFYAVQITVPADTTRLRLIIAPQTGSTTHPGPVFYTGIVLGHGSFPVDTPPTLSDDGSSGMWGGQAFTNLARNPLLAERWPAPRAFFSGQVLARLGIFPLAFSNVVASLLDPAAAWYWRISLTAMQDSFWAVFGWGEVRLTSIWIYRVLSVISLVGVVGFLVALARKKITVHTGVLLLLLALVGLTWGIALVSNLLQESLIAHVYIPQARYGYPVVIPTLLVLGSGWLAAGQALRRIWPDAARLGAPLFVVSFLALDVISLLRIIQYY